MRLLMHLLSSKRARHPWARNWTPGRAASGGGASSTRPPSRCDEKMHPTTTPLPGGHEASEEGMGLWGGGTTRGGAVWAQRRSLCAVVDPPAPLTLGAPLPSAMPFLLRPPRATGVCPLTGMGGVHRTTRQRRVGLPPSCGGAPGPGRGMGGAWLRDGNPVWGGGGLCPAPRGWPTAPRARCRPPPPCTHTHTGNESPYLAFLFTRQNPLTPPSPRAPLQHASPSCPLPPTAGDAACLLRGAYCVVVCVLSLGVYRPPEAHQHILVHTTMHTICAALPSSSPSSLYPLPPPPPTTRQGGALPRPAPACVPGLDGRRAAPPPPKKGVTEVVVVTHKAKLRPHKRILVWAPPERVSYPRPPFPSRGRAGNPARASDLSLRPTSLSCVRASPTPHPHPPHNLYLLLLLDL
eukprot:TRINITY_DN549_c0_g1_i2.p1 TRINITY_DN549_c0_g1~~TRINITY_DN549_c0_g1_i2.p1  ORF type:complete len:407 (+),score=-86.79 TRINITY_DN549_c0_g1_i2:96-1316(+)